MIPQLRIRTEYSFRTNYGPLGVVADRLQEIGCPLAGIVDTGGTWGHVQWEKATAKVGIQPAFGGEVTIPQEDGRKPRCWVLAADPASFYRLMSAKPSSVAEMAAAKGVIRFAGAALSDPDAFDYIDVNPRSIRATKRAIALHQHTGKPLVLTADNDYPRPADRLRFLAWDDSKRMTIQHIPTDAEFAAAMSWIGDEYYQQALRGTYEVAERLQGIKLRRAPIINVPGDLLQMAVAGRDYRLAKGHIKEWTNEYHARFEREMELIKDKQYESYFIVVADLIAWAKEHMLVGPGRGSSAGSLVCYLLRITEVDPLVHHLIFERFIDVNRFDLPDIDIDFNDQKREMVFEYLADKYGRECVARIGSVNRLKPRSVIAHVAKKLGIPQGAAFSVINVLVDFSSGDSLYGHALDNAFSTTKPGKEFLAHYPEASLMGELENHASHTGVHAAGVIVSNEPVTEYCTVIDGVAQIDKKDAEYLNLLKIDALGLRTLGVIEDSQCVTSDELYGLTLDDPEVFNVLNQRKFSGVFQFEGRAQRSVAVHIPITSFGHIDHITALARPGPLGGGASQLYIDRNSGRKSIEYLHQSMEDYLSETQGVVLYQEQVMRIIKEIGCFNWQDVTTIRKVMSGSYGKEFFDSFGAKFTDGAATWGIDSTTAAKIWEEICSFGAWGMNKSHTVSYSIISYWCAFMKKYHPLEYAAATLRNAKDDEQTTEVLRELTAEGVTFIPFDPDLSDANWSAKDGRLVGGFNNLTGIGPVKAAYYIQRRNTAGLDAADRAKLAKLAPKHRDLRPAHTLWGAIYDDPDAHNIHGTVKEFAQLTNRENAVVICKLIQRKRRDLNEAVLVAKRHGEIKTGQTLFLDMFVVDDSISKPIAMRINPRLWHQLGEPIADRAVDNVDWFLARGNWLGDFNMFAAEKIKCLTNKEVV